MLLVSTGPAMASAHAKDLGMGVFQESWKPWLGGRASDEPHCCRVWQVGEKICGVDSLRCGALGGLIRTYLGKSKGSL